MDELKSLRKELISVRKELEELKETISEMAVLLSGETKAKALKYDEMKPHLDNLSFEVTGIAKSHDDNGDVVLKVNYGKPYGEIRISMDGNVHWDGFSAAMNMLNLISYEDMGSIAEEIESESK